MIEQKNTRCLQRILSCKGAPIENTKLKPQWQHRRERTALSKAVHVVELPLKNANKTGENRFRIWKTSKTIHKPLNEGS